MTQFCLVRHGQTDWNLEGRFQGQSDVELNDLGRAQAHSLARRLSARSLTAIHSSDLKRAYVTAEIIASHLRLPVIRDARLREINQGAWEGMHEYSIKSQFSELWVRRSIDPVHLRPPGGETVAEVARRVHSALDEIAHHNPQATILISSHGLALATVICKVRGIPLREVYDFIPANADPILIDWDGSTAG